MIHTQNQSNKFKIRHAENTDAKKIADVHVASWQNTYAGIISPSYLAGLNIDDKTLFWREILHCEYSRIYVAENHEHKIVGFISSNSKNTIATIHAIYILKEFQRLKLGTLLFLQTVEFLSLNGCQKIELGVLKQNTSRKFYEKLNGKLAETHLIKIADEEHEELLIQWDDLYSLKIVLQELLLC